MKRLKIKIVPFIPAKIYRAILSEIEEKEMEDENTTIL